MPQENIPKIVERVLPAVASITISKLLTVYERQPFGGASLPGFEDLFMVPRGKRKIKVGGGSGFIVDKEGLILTNRHVVADPTAEYVAILNDERKFTPKVLASDPLTEIAILKIDAKDLPVIELGDSSKLELGQQAVAIGNALGAFRNTVSTGVISGLSREITAGDMLRKEMTTLRGLIQTDAAINPGNSGGPLLDISGKAIGINVATVFLAENIGFALPINTAKRALEDVKKYGRIRRPFLGIRYVPITKGLRDKYRIPVKSGILVISEPYPGGEAVALGSPAEKAGVHPFDILLEAAKEKISRKNPLQDILQRCKVGDEIDLRVLREGQELNLKAKLEERR